METLQLKIGTDVEHVLLEIPESQPVLSGNYDDRNWLEVDVTVRAGAWSGCYRADLRREDFVPFRQAIQKLYDSLSGAANFDTLEEWIEVRLRGNGRGVITVEGEAWDRPKDGNHLEFHLRDIDQTFLPAMLAQLDAIIKQYPVIGRP